MALPLIALAPLVTILLEKVTTFFLNAQLSKLAFRVIFYGSLVALNAAFIAAMMALLAGVAVLAPPQFSFAFGFLPYDVYGLFGLYVGAQISKKILTWKETFILHGTK